MLAKEGKEMVKRDFGEQGFNITSSHRDATRGSTVNGRFNQRLAGRVMLKQADQGKGRLADCA